MYRAVLCPVFLLLFSGTALAGDMCGRFAGMWAPVYERTFETFPHMRPYMDGPAPEADSFIKGLVEARRVVIDCEARTIQSVQGRDAATPRRFNIDSADERRLVINFIAERFINPGTDLERGMAEHLEETAPRVVFTLDGEYLHMSNPEHESFVMRRALSVNDSESR